MKPFVMKAMVPVYFHVDAYDQVTSIVVDTAEVVPVTVIRDPSRGWWSEDEELITDEFTQRYAAAQELDQPAWSLGWGMK